MQVAVAVHRQGLHCLRDLCCILRHFSHSARMDVSAHFSALDDEEFFVIEGSGWRGRRESDTPMHAWWQIDKDMSLTSRPHHHHTHTTPPTHHHQHPHTTHHRLSHTKPKPSEPRQVTRRQKQAIRSRPFPVQEECSRSPVAALLIRWEKGWG